MRQNLSLCQGHLACRLDNLLQFIGAFGVGTPAYYLVRPPLVGRALLLILLQPNVVAIPSAARVRGFRG